MRKKARIADALIEANKTLRAELRRRPPIPHTANAQGHEPTEVQREQVSTLAGLGVPLTGIARFMHITFNTLKEHYSDELEVGKVYANVKVSSTLFAVATDARHPGVVPAAKKWLESRAPEEWRQVNTVVNEKGTGAGPPIIDSRKLSQEERAQLRSLMEKMVAPEDPGLAAPLDESVVSEQGLG